MPILPPGMPAPGGAPGGPPGGGAPGGPPGGPPGGTGAATMPMPQMGSAAGGMAAVKTGIEALQKSLPSLPMGSELHSAVLKAIGDIAKHMDHNQGGGQAAQIQQLVAMARDAHANPAQAAALSGMSAGGGGGAPAGAAA